MKFFFSAVFFLIVSSIFAAAPLSSGYALAPKATATREEKAQAYVDARNQVISASLKYLNTPYRYGGMSPEGLDCSGFICITFKDALGVSLPRSASALYSWTEKISFEEAQPGDLLFFKTDNSGKITHVGLYLGERRFIHAASVGSQTGVIINSLDDGSWSRTLAGAGRVLPEAPHGAFTNNAVGNNTVAVKFADKTDSASGRVSAKEKNSASSEQQSGRLLVGVAAAPTWSFIKDGQAVRGVASHIRLGADVPVVKRRMLLGIELRPEYDWAMGVFRLPLTLSFGLTDRVRIFGGPALSAGNATITTKDGERVYSNGTTWFGTAGLTIAPFILSTKAGEFAPYVEGAWQSYFSENADKNLNADFSAGFRFSTGLRWTIQVNK